MSIGDNRRESVVCVRNQQTCFSDSSITNRYTLYESRSAHFLPQKIIIFRENLNKNIFF